MEALSTKAVLILGVIAVAIIGVNITIFLLLSSYTSTTSQFFTEYPELGLKRDLSPYSATQAGQNSKTISVTGIGMAKTKPDRALISLSVVTQAESAEEAVYQNAVKVNHVYESLKAVGVVESRIENSAYSLTPVLDYSNRDTPRIMGYTCSSTVKVTVEDLNRVGKVIDNAVSVGVNYVSSLQFTVSDEELYRLELEALRNAVKDADSKARVIANAAGVTLTNLISISILDDSSYYTKYSSESVLSNATPTAGNMSTPILPPEEVSVTIIISAVYEFR